MRRDYRQMLSELQGLLGEQVSVEVHLIVAKKWRPLVLLEGKLGSGLASSLADETEAAITEAIRARANAPDGEWVFFMVGEPRTSFVMRRDDFKHGERYEDGVLVWETGKARFSVGPRLTVEESLERFFSDA
jgi:hypothetical protein